MAVSSMRPQWANRLATYMTGQGAGRVGSAAGALGSRGIPTSMRGRFAKYGGQYDDTTGAQAALATTHQTHQAIKSGAMARAGQANQAFDATQYEQTERRRRGLMPRNPAAAKPVTGGTTAPAPKPEAGFEPVMDKVNQQADNAVKGAAALSRAPSYIGTGYGTASRGNAPPKIDPTHVNMTDSRIEGFSRGGSLFTGRNKT